MARRTPQQARSGFIRPSRSGSGTRPRTPKANGQAGWQLPPPEASNPPQWTPPPMQPPEGTQQRVMRSSFERTNQHPNRPMSTNANQRMHTQAGGPWRGDEDPNAQYDPRGEVTSEGRGLGRDPLLTHPDPRVRAQGVQQQHDYEAQLFSQGGTQHDPQFDQFDGPSPQSPAQPQAQERRVPVQPQVQPSFTPPAFHVQPAAAQAVQPQPVNAMPSHAQLAMVGYAHVDLLWDWIRQDQGHGENFFMRPIRHSGELNQLIGSLVDGERIGTSVIRSIVWGEQLIGFVLLSPIMSTERVAVLHTYLHPQAQGQAAIVVTPLLAQLASFVPGYRLALLNPSSTDTKAFVDLGFKPYALLVR